VNYAFNLFSISIFVVLYYESHLVKRIYFSCLLIMHGFFSIAQSNEGTDFWFTFMEHKNVGANTMVAMITARTATTGVLEIPGLGWSRNFSVGANDVTIITLPREAENIGSENINDIAAHITTNGLVSVYIHQYASLRADATLVLPTNVLSNNYYTMTYEGYSDNQGLNPSEIAVVGMEDNTKVNILLSANTRGGRPKGTVHTIVLDRGEAYQIQGQSAEDDFTGTLVTSDKKIAVFSGATWAGIPIHCTVRDNLLEMMAPITTWGKRYLSAPSKNTTYDVYRIIASENNTAVEVHGTNTDRYQLNKGEFVEYNSSEAKYIIGDKPIMVAQYFIGRSCNGISPNGDPSMLILNALEQTRDTVTLYNSSFQNIVENYINVIFQTQDAPFIKIDNVPLNTVSQIVTVPGNKKYSYASVQVNTGSHTITSQGCGVIASAYGYGNAESYAYSGGASYKDINSIPFIDGGCVKTPLVFTTNLDSVRYSHSWSFGDGNSIKKSKVLHSYNDTGRYLVKLEVYDRCLDITEYFQKDILVTIRKALVVTPLIEACETEVVKLTASDIADANYTWTGPNNFKSTEQTHIFTRALAAQSGKYQIIGNYFGCPTLPSFSEVVIHKPPTFDLGKDRESCLRDSAVTILAPIQGNYTWSDSSHGDRIHAEKEGTYFLKITDQNECTTVDSIFISDICPPKVLFPNVISAKAINENNAFFSPLALDIIDQEIVIFDRWGNKVYQASGTISWDGKLNGVLLSTGVYTYKYNYSGVVAKDKVRAFEIYGDILLIK
jgi:hypothetical protein